MSNVLLRKASICAHSVITCDLRPTPDASSLPRHRPCSCSCPFRAARALTISCRCQPPHPNAHAPHLSTARLDDAVRRRTPGIPSASSCTSHPFSRACHLHGIAHGGAGPQSPLQAFPASSCPRLGNLLGDDPPWPLGIHSEPVACCEVQTHPFRMTLQQRLLQFRERSAKW